jgi:hypothetical protein
MAAPARLKHPNSDSVAALRSIAEFAVVLLVVLGVGGTVYRLAGPNGWLSEIFSRSVAGGVAAIFSILIVGFSAWVLRGWIPKRHRHQYPEVANYVFAGLGLFYAYELASKGTL